ncbi:aldo/keto reductase [Streptomyces sp. H27-D2]|uniref:aldo/keto reductase n=1 Tax=Streptomyces sp. H27-D2 TaxID=3046304 RepID=UPI002DBC1655|nr:aldo/keto reductase [Streptomyces sp. H27-D2]MEC4015651.1 aldo/keto reductase [Streptomyces sp. H27-D2]
MQRRILGGTGISVSDHALGTMMLGAWGNPDHDEGVRIVHRALDAGINFIDTADIYASGESEEIVGKALKGRRDDVVLATKAYNRMGKDANHGGSSRRWITRAIEDSLRRLGTDYIDLYQVHRADPNTDIDETLSVLSDLVRAGKVRAIGTSTFPAELLVEAHWVAERRGHIRFRTEQPPYSILARGVEAAVLPTAQRYGMGVLTWGPLAAGWLSGRYTQSTQASDIDLSGGRTAMERHKFDPSLPDNARKLAAVGELTKLAGDAGLTLAHLAIAFVRSHPAVTSALIGPRTLAQLDDLLAGTETVLSADVLDRIDEIVPPGTDLNRADSYYEAPAVADKALRRR